MTGKEYNEQFSDEELESEIWKDIPGYEGLYQVSNLGRVRSLDRAVKNRHPYTKKIKGRIIIPFQSKTARRFAFKPSKNHVYGILYLHRLVAEIFIGSCPEEMECCHNDGNPLNNRVENLRYDTHKNNMEDKKKHGTYRCGEQLHWTKFTEQDILDIRELYKTGKYLQKELAVIFNTTEKYISAVVNRVTWKNI